MYENEKMLPLWQPGGNRKAVRRKRRWSYLFVYLFICVFIYLVIIIYLFMLVEIRTFGISILLT